ncbi:hypothetical protein [Rhodococcus sp. X156]|uniref:hypothetical protein n=1 Tax=Rhodococcus sp. X156 TaxID=2499145 RepID=UPI0013E30EC4|nr:hypothetical protein [Rhodococcus sp. X156]
MTVVPPVTSPVLPVLTRRRFALGATAVAMTLAASGCGVLGGSDSPDQQEQDVEPRVDPLIALAAAARADAAAATQLATTVPEQAVVLSTVSADRTAHAEAIEAEVTRAAGPTPATPQSGATSTTQPATTSAAGSTAPATPGPATVAELKTELQAHERAAAELARTEPAYRAGLLGSVAAACASHQAVLA